MKVIKRNGTEVPFNKEKIANAVKAANKREITEDQVEIIADTIEQRCSDLNRPVEIEEIQDMVEESLYNYSLPLLKRFMLYRYNHNNKRAESSFLDRIRMIVENSSTEAKEENANKNPTIVSTQRDYIAGEVDKELVSDILSEDIIDAHKKGIIHKHDTDYIRQYMTNCGLVDLDDMLQNGTVLNNVGIHKPHRFTTACTIATQIMAAVASSQYGGQSLSLTALAKFIDVSRQNIRKKVQKEFAHIHVDGVEIAALIEDITESRLHDEVVQGVQTLQYQILSLSSTNGQSPFVTLMMYLNEAGDDQRLRDDLAMLIEEVLKQRIQGVETKDGHFVAPAFPKLIYVTEPDNVSEDSKYWYLTELAAECINKRMVPDCVSEKKMFELKEGNCFPPMGCRSFLSPYKDANGNYKFYGRFNLGVTTINLIDVALSSKGDYEEFDKIMDERLELCHKASEQIINHLKNTKASVAPALWMYGAYARLDADETIEQLFYNGYCTISLGYAGLYECTKYMTGESHTQEKGKEFAMHVMDKLNEATVKWKEESPYHMGYALYGSPIESTTYKFAKCLQKRFGVVEGITDKNYITNSYHVPVFEKIDAFTKLKLESEFQDKSLGGAISYVELPSMTNNVEALKALIKYSYETIMYAEFNTKIDYCSECGYEGEIEIEQDKDSHKLIWKCPKCGCTDTSKMTIVRRVCGYISSNDFNQGRMGDINDRVLHL